MLVEVVQRRHPVVANERVGQHEYLPRVRRVGERLRVADHPRVKDNLSAGGRVGGAKGGPGKGGAVGEGEGGGGHFGGRGCVAGGSEVRDRGAVCFN